MTMAIRAALTVAFLGITHLASANPSLAMAEGGALRDAEATTPAAAAASIGGRDKDIRLAQSAGPAANNKSDKLEEIVVSANRLGAQDLQKVPLAITALDSVTLERTGLQSLGDITRNTPGITVQEQGGGQNSIVMRGITTDIVAGSINIEAQQTVSIYLDDTPISITGLNPDLRIFDLERVEVIRGPQGTLYGAGAMAGNIRYISRKPDSKNFEASTEVGGVSTKGEAGYNFRGMLNQPLIDGALALRANIYKGREPGFIDNVGTGKKNANWQDTTQARLALRYETDGPLTADLSYIFARNETGGYNAVNPDLGSLKISTRRGESFLDKFNLVNLTLNYRAELFDVISSTSYIDRDTHQVQASLAETLVAGQTPVFTGGTPLLNPTAAFVIDNKIRDFSQELRIASKAWDRVKGQAGVFFEDQKWSYVQDFPVEGFDAFMSANSSFGPNFNSLDYFAFHENDFFSQFQTPHTRQFAVFGEATFSVTDKFDVTVGLRRFNWKQTYSTWTGGFTGVDNNRLPLVADGRSTEQGTNPRLNLTYNVTDDLMVFAEAAKGFRYGGINQPASQVVCGDALAQEGLTNSPPAYGPDHVWTYSLGEKAKLLDGRMTLNATAFYTKWSDVQTLHNIGELVPAGSCGYSYERNKGNVISKGVEVESQLQATTALQIALSASYTESTTDGPIQDLGAPDGARAPYTPRVMASVQGVYTWPVSFGTVLLQADYGYRGNVTNYYNSSSEFYRVLPAEKIVNAALVLQRGRAEWSVYGRNLTDEHTIAFAPLDSFNKTIYLGRPLTFGAKFAMHF